MTFKETEFDGLFEVIPQKHGDDRGYFLETYHKEKFSDAGINYDFLQDNQSFSVKNTLRGLHLQRPPHQQVKYVRVLKGKVLDVVVDLRQESKTFGKYYSKVLSEENQHGLVVPGEFAHGFLALEDSVFCYKCSNLYNKAS
ncbi:dTDP-4-dehydrorhamnose 3,5-epimerase, partial [Fulvivirga sp. RKSG066]|uniref:dTDP-4-dehydrorhamnose 3,5-epimerase n=1 Tax=Fulvivirga aurantia TaxID=2529383 RepID=UPI0012BC4486